MLRADTHPPARIHPSVPRADVRLQCAPTSVYRARRRASAQRTDMHLPCAPTSACAACRHECMTRRRASTLRADMHLSALFLSDYLSALSLLDYSCTVSDYSLSWITCLHCHGLLFLADYLPDCELLSDYHTLCHRIGSAPLTLALFVLSVAFDCNNLFVFFFSFSTCVVALKVVHWLCGIKLNTKSGCRGRQQFRQGRL